MAAISRGEKFRRAILAEFDLGVSERLLLDELADTIDTLDTLDADQVVERRLQRLVLARLLGALAEPAPKTSSGGPLSGPSVRGKRAADARWGRIRAQEN